MQVWIRRFALLLLPLGFLAIMVAAPLLSLAFYDGEGAWAEVVADDYMRLRLGWTVAQAVLTCILVTALGVPAAWVLARMDFAGRRTVLRLLMLPFVMPTLVAGMGVLALFGAHGMLAAGWQDTPWLLIYGTLFSTCRFWCARRIRDLCVCRRRGCSRRNLWARTRGEGLSGSNGRWCARGLPAARAWCFYIVFRLRAGLAARRRTFCNSGSGNLPAGGV